MTGSLIERLAAGPPSHRLSTPPCASPSGCAAGQGRLEIVRQASRSVVTRAFATSPLRLLTPANHGRAAWIYTSSYGGGLVDGDRIDIDVTVGAGAAAFLSTQASTKIYRSPRGTSASLTGRVCGGGLLIAAPDPVVCFAGARYRQVQRFHVADDGTLVVIDVLVSGRRAAGERWAFADYRSLIEITLGDRLIVHDAVALRESDGRLASRLGRFDALAIAVLAGRALRPDAERLVAASAAHAVTRRAEQLMTASPLGEEGCILRIAGTSVEQVARTLRESLRLIPERLGDDPWARKW